MKHRKLATTLSLSALLLLGLAVPGAAGTFTGKVRDVSDGDTLVVKKGLQVWVVQLAGIDAPELSQEFGADARGHLINLVRGRKVTVEVLDAPRPANVVARITVDGKDLAATLVAQGLAWADADSATPEIRAAERTARESGLGLWASNDPQPPWKHRSHHA